VGGPFDKAHATRAKPAPVPDSTLKSLDNSDETPGGNDVADPATVEDNALHRPRRAGFGPATNRLTARGRHRLPRAIAIQKAPYVHGAAERCRIVSAG
jgi:hypothetical protein